MAEPSSSNNSTLVAVLIPGAVFGGVLLLMLLCACCFGAAAGATRDECGKPPDQERDPIAYARWKRECERKRQATGASSGEGMQLLRFAHSGV